MDDGGVGQGHVISNATLVTCCFQWSQCQFTADCENIDVTVGTHSTRQSSASAFLLGTCAHHSVTQSNKTADGPRSGAAVPAVPLISLSASLRERSWSQGLEVVGGGV